MKHINLTNWHGSLTDWTKLNYIYGGLDDSYAVKGNLRIDKDLYNYVEYRESKNLLLEQKQINLSPGTEQWVQFNFNVEIGQTYTLANYEPAKSNEVWQCTTLGYTNFTVTPRTFTATTSVITIRCGANSLTSAINYQSKIMIVKGSPAPSGYEPYFTGKKYVVTENLDIVDMGTIEWSYNSSYQVFYTYLSGKKNGRTNLSCDLYTTVAKDYPQLNNMEIAGTPNTNGVNVKNTDYSTTEDFTTAMSGIMLIYELATPVIEVVE